jgi:hypothetical protein
MSFSPDCCEVLFGPGCGDQSTSLAAAAAATVVMETTWFSGVLIVQQDLGMTTFKNEALAVEGSAVMSIYMSVSN